METKEYIKYLLENYKEMQTMLSMLKLELESFQEMSNEEALESLVYARAVGERVQTSSISNKTASVSIIYKEFAKRINRENRAEIVNSILPLEYELKLLEMAVEGLPVKEKNIIKEIYFVGISAMEVAYKNNITEQWLFKIRRCAISKLASFYEQYPKITKGVNYEKNECK